MIKYFTRSTIIITISLLLSGCWDSQNPENLAYIMTMGIDISEEEDGKKYKFSLAPAKTQAQDVEMLSSSGNTIASAVVGVDSKNSRKTDLGQLKIIVLGEEIFADENNFLSLFDELERTQEISEKVMILCADGKAENVLKVLMNEEQGLFLWDFYQNTGRDVAITKGLDLDTFLAEYWEQNGCVVIPKIQTVDEKIQLGGGVVLKDGAYNYTMNKEEEEGYLLITGDGFGAIIEAEDDEFFIPVEIISQKNKYEFYNEGNKFTCYITADFIGDLLSSYNDDAFNSNKKNELEKILEENIKDKMEETLEIAINNNDFEALGIASKFRRKFPNLEEINNDNFQQNIDIVIETNLKLRDIGKIR